MSKLASLLFKTEKSEEEALWTQEINKSITDFLKLIDKVYQEEADGGFIYYTILDHVVQAGNQDVAEELVEKLHELDKLNSYIANKHGQEALELLLEKDYSDIAKYLIEHCAKPVNNNSEAAKPDTEEEEEEKFAMYNIEQKESAPYTYEIIDQDTKYIMVDAPYINRHHDLLGLQELQEPIETKENQNFFPLHEAIKKGDIDKILALLNSHTNLINTPNSQGISPLQMAYQCNRTDIANIIIEAYEATLENEYKSDAS